MLATLLPLHEMMHKQARSCTRLNSYRAASALGLTRSAPSQGGRLVLRDLWAQADLPTSVCMKKGQMGAMGELRGGRSYSRPNPPPPTSLPSRAQGPTTLKEIAFVQAYGRELDEAYDWCLKYKQSRKVGGRRQRR